MCVCVNMSVYQTCVLVCEDEGAGGGGMKNFLPLVQKGHLYPK